MINEILKYIITHKALSFGVLGMFIILASYEIGVRSVEKKDLCSWELQENTRLLLKQRSLEKLLVECRAKSSGRTVLQCFDDCDKRVQTALDEAQAWACED